MALIINETGTGSNIQHTLTMSATLTSTVMVVNVNSIGSSQVSVNYGPIFSIGGESGPPLADTGWRDISDLLNPGWSGAVRVRRVGNMGYIHTADVHWSGVGDDLGVILTLPEHFRPDHTYLLEGYSPVVRSTGEMEPTEPTADYVINSDNWGFGGTGFAFFASGDFPDPADWPGAPWTPDTGSGIS